MTEALLLVVVGSLVPVSVATLVIAVLTLRKAHSYVAMVEQRLESFHEGQLLLLALLREQNRRPVEQSSAEERSPEERASEGEQAEDLVRLERDRLELAVHSRRHAGRGDPQGVTVDRGLDQGQTRLGALSDELAPPVYDHPTAVVLEAG